jgi:hypothetical protein
MSFNIVSGREELEGRCRAHPQVRQQPHRHHHHGGRGGQGGVPQHGGQRLRLCQLQHQVSMLLNSFFSVTIVQAK